MADRPRESDWWLASDGKWYPPDLESEPAGTDAPGRPVRRTTVAATHTTAVSVMLVVASAALLGSAYSGFRYASSLQKYSGVLSDADTASLESVELIWASWSALAIFFLVVTGGLVIRWTYLTSRRLDGHGPIGRRWRGGWAIGGWLIPIANLVLPKLVCDEIERIAQVPFADVPIGEEWRSYSHSQLGDLWWLLWIGGVIPSQAVQFMLGDPAADAGRLSVVLTVNSISHAMFAGAGVALAMLLLRIDRSLSD